MSQLTGAQKASLIDALLSGYTSDEQLAELLDLHLDVKLAEIAQDGTLREQVFAVVTWAEANGRTKELALKAQKLRVRNAKRSPRSSTRCIPASGPAAGSSGSVRLRVRRLRVVRFRPVRIGSLESGFRSPC